MTENHSLTEAVAARVHLVHSAMQFLRVVRYRKNVVIACVAISAVVGGLYFATAIRLYQSRAQLLVLDTGDELNARTASTEASQQPMMPTYEGMIVSRSVAQGALKYLRPEHRVDMKGAPQSAWPAIIQRGLYVTTVRRTNILDVAFRSRDPEAAAAVVDAVVRSYIDFMENTHKGGAAANLKILTREKQDVDAKLARKQREVLEAARRFGDLGLQAESTELNPVVQRALRLNERLTEAFQKRLEAQAALQALGRAVQSGEDLHQHALAIENALGREFLLSGLGLSTSDAATRARIEQQLVRDQAELQTQSQFLGPAHPAVLANQDRIRYAEQYLLGYQNQVNQRLVELSRKQLAPLLVDMARQRLASAWEHEKSLFVSYEQAKAEAVNMAGDLAELQMMNHDLKRLRDNYDALMKNIESLDLSHDQRGVRTAVITEPTVSSIPVAPRLSFVVLMSLLVGLSGGLGLVHVLDTLDDRFRSPEELQAHLGAPVLALIRQLPPLEGTGVAAFHAHADPSAVESEAFRTLRTALAFSEHETRRVVISSAEPGDGKSTVLGNVGVSFAQAGKRTLLIDADLRRPGLSTMLDLRTQPGLSELLRSDESIEQLAPRLVRSTGVASLDVLPCGRRPVNPAELLAGPTLAELLEWADLHYDQILIDSPPALAASDAAIVGRLVDGALLLVTPSKNQRRVVRRAADMLFSLGVELLGVVVNRIGGDNEEHYYGYGAGYGYRYANAYHQDAARQHDEEDPQTQDATHDEFVPGDDSAVGGVIPRRAA